jgi:hypothetical protein
VSRGQRLTFLAIAAAIAAVAVVLLAGGSDPEQTSENAAATPTPTREPAAATATRTPTATPRPKLPPLLVAGTERALTFEEGETVRFRVRSKTPEEVHVHGYDILRKVTPGKTTTVSFKANITGIFEIELEQSHQLLAQLKVVP